MPLSKTIICEPQSFDRRFKEWFDKVVEDYRESLNPKEIYCDKSWFTIIIDKIDHDGNNHYILYHENDGGLANMPNDDHY